VPGKDSQLNMVRGLGEKQQQGLCSKVKTFRTLRFKRNYKNGIILCSISRHCPQCGGNATCPLWNPLAEFCEKNFLSPTFNYDFSTNRPAGGKFRNLLKFRGIPIAPGWSLDRRKTGLALGTQSPSVVFFQVKLSGSHERKTSK
jgi:hypothetical protein